MENILKYKHQLGFFVPLPNNNRIKKSRYEKNNLLLVVSMLLVANLFSQVNFNVLTPSSLSNSYQFLYANPIDAWGTPDMTDTANSITGQLVFVDDGTIGDTLGCNPLINGTQVNGNIAVVYRGSCQFGTKALQAQNAGAIGVIIINNTMGISVMVGGNDGINVTIPTIMISQADGILLRNEILQNNVTAFLGNKTGKFANDVGAYQKDIIRKQFYVEPELFQYSFSAINVPFGIWVRNFGNQNQTNVLTSVSLVENGNIIFSNSTVVNNLNSGDSIFVSLGNYGMLNNGPHSIIYKIIPQNVDEYVLDNTLTTNFYLTNGLSNQTLSYASVDSTTLLPKSNLFISSSDEVCIAYPPSPSLMFGSMAIGLTVVATSGSANNIVGRSLTTHAYEWTDYFTDINDPNFAFSNIYNVGTETFIYTNNNQNGVPIFIPFTTNIPLTPSNSRFLFCVQSDYPDLMLSFDNRIDYTTTQNTFLQPLFFFKNGNSYSPIPMNLVPSISISIDILTSTPDKENTVDIKPFPNPAKDRIEIPFNFLFNNAYIEVIDEMGKIVATKKLHSKLDKKMSFDVSGLENGLYLFKIKFDTNQRESSFKVIIQR